MKFAWLFLPQFIFSTSALLPVVRNFAGTTNDGNINGVGTNARFDNPDKGDISPDGSIFLIADNHNIRRVDFSTSNVSTFAGKGGAAGSTNGVGTNARFKNPSSVFFSPNGTYALVTDTGNHLIRKLDISTAVVTTFAGGGSKGATPGRVNDFGTNALFHNPYAVAISPNGLFAVVVDYSNNMIRHIILSTAFVTTLAGQAKKGFENDVGTAAKFNSPTAVDFLLDGSAILVADRDNNMIRKIIISTSVVTTLVGRTKAGSANGVGSQARFSKPYDVRMSPDGVYALVADKSNHKIRIIYLSTSSVDDLIGTGKSGTTNGIGANAELNRPRGVAISPNGGSYIISDYSNHMLRFVFLLDHPTSIPTIPPTPVPSSDPTFRPSVVPTRRPTFSPSHLPTFPPSCNPTSLPSFSPTQLPTLAPTVSPSTVPTNTPTFGPTAGPTYFPSVFPTLIPTAPPSTNPTLNPSVNPTPDPTHFPSAEPSFGPTRFPSVPPTLNPSATPTLDPTVTPSVQPTQIPTLAPSHEPSKIPTNVPSISPQPTSPCPAGYHLKIAEEEGGDGSCIACVEGFYSTGGTETSCQSCEPWTGNKGQGNSECQYVTAQNSSSDAIPIAICGFYILLSFICFLLILCLGESWKVIFNIILITTDQVTDILYTWYSLFANSTLLYLAAFFCVTNLLLAMIYILSHVSYRYTFMSRGLKRCSKIYNDYDIRCGHYPEGSGPKYAGWVLHSIHGWNIAEVGPFIVIYYGIDALWILLRLFIMLVIFIVTAICQLLLLLLGVTLYVSKLMSIPVVEKWFWTIWNPSYLNDHPPPTSNESVATYNALVLLEVCSECIPQIAIQVTNTILISENWTPLTILSVTVSGSMIIFVFHHFWYKHKELLRSGDPTYTSFDFRRIPKFDMFEKITKSMKNKRQGEYVPANKKKGKNPPPSVQELPNARPIPLGPEEKDEEKGETENEDDEEQEEEEEKDEEEEEEEEEEEKEEKLGEEKERAGEKEC